MVARPMAAAGTGAPLTGGVPAQFNPNSPEAMAAQLLAQRQAGVQWRPGQVIGMEQKPKPPPKPAPPPKPVEPPMPTTPAVTVSFALDAPFGSRDAQGALTLDKRVFTLRLAALDANGARRVALTVGAGRRAP